MKNTTTATTEIPSIHAKSPALVDEPITIRISGLPPEQPHTVSAVLEEDHKVFVSYAHYTSDCKGEIISDQSSSVGGLYKGVEPMGLFWSMVQAEGQKPGLRIMKKEVDNPFRIELYVTEGHVAVTDRNSAKLNSLTSTVIERYYKGVGVRKFNIKTYDKDTRIRGTFFLPAGDGPFPGVVDLFGTAGGLNEYRAALLASRGFASLSLAYFNFDDLPQTLVMDLGYISEAVDWLYAQPEVLKSGIGMVGVSKGAELILETAVINPKVKAVVPINGTCCFTYGIHLHNGQERAVCDPAINLAEETSEGFIARDCTYKCPIPEEAYFKIEKAKSHFLFVGGDDDQQSHPGHMTILADRLRKAGKTNYRILLYHGAGHLIEPPYTPLSRTAYHKLVGGIVLNGGQPVPHAHAQEHSWREILLFLREHLTDIGSIMAFGGETKANAEAQEHSWTEIQKFQTLDNNQTSKL